MTVVSRRTALITMLSAVGVACGGGNSGTGTPIAGTLQTLSLTARVSGTTYPLYLYLPPGGGAGRPDLPVVYLLDGESRFQTMVDIVEAGHIQVVVVGIGNEALRNRDYVPLNQCTPGGTGHVAFLDFIRQELIPFIESGVASKPSRRALLGHSHGGSFVLYALLNEPVKDRRFQAYLASDASIDCMKQDVLGWEAGFAAANTALPVRFHLAYSANLANAGFAVQIQSRHYQGLSFLAQAYDGGHIGMIPKAFLSQPPE